MLVVRAVVVSGVFVGSVVLVIVFKIIVEVVERVVLFLFGLLVVEGVDGLVFIVVFFAFFESRVLHDFLFDACA